MAMMSLFADGEIAAMHPAIYGVVGLIIGLIIGAVAVRLAVGRPAAAEPEKPAGPPKPSGAPLRLLTLLQREGRLLDFLMEDVQAYSDAQIGAAVRDIHRSCRKSLHDYLTIAPVISGAEEERVTIRRISIPPRFDWSAT